MAERVLMIEDDQRLSAMVAEYLEPLGIHVTAAATAAEGMRLLGKSAFDGLILDVMLPDLDGFEVCRRVRSEHDVPILNAHRAVMRWTASSGWSWADDYLALAVQPARVAVDCARSCVDVPRRVASVSRFCASTLGDRPRCTAVSRRGRPRW
jgi:DNA-binding response OmpR family regulator